MEITPYKNQLGLKNKCLRALWQLTYCLFFKHTPNIVFWEWRAFILRCFGAKIGKHCKIRPSAKIWAPWNLALEDYVSIGPNAAIYCVDKISLSTKVCISQEAYICTASHNISQQGHPLITAPITIAPFAWIGARAFVGMGVTVGEGAVVGACAAVFKDVEPWTVVGGNPAKFIKKRIIKDA